MRVVSHVYRNDLRANVNVHHYYQVVSIMSDMFCTISIKQKAIKVTSSLLNHDKIVAQMSIIVREDETKLISVVYVCR